MHGTAAGWWLVGMRILQGVGGAMLMANSGAILTDAFPATERGLALGLNQVAGIAGSFIGLVLGDVLGPMSWRYVFLVSVPFGVLGTIWSYLKLREMGERRPARLDWWGNLTFGTGLIAVLVGGGLATLAVFRVIEVADPMFRLSLFRIRPFTAGNAASLLSSLGRGGLMFILIIWLQGIYLPMHGYSFSRTPLWAGIAMLPLTVGFLVAGPVSGWLSDRFGARPFATGGMLVAALSFLLLELLPVNFNYWEFAGILLLNGIGMGLFASPNRAGIMNSLPAHQRGVGAGMSATFQNSAMVLSIGIFFTLMIAGLSATLPASLYHGLVTQGVPCGAGGEGRGAPADVGAVRRAARLQPDPDAARVDADQALTSARRVPDRAQLLPVADLRAVLARAGGRVRLRDRRLPHRRRRLTAPRQALRARPARGASPGARHDPE
jgi:MFS family permease